MVSTSTLRVLLLLGLVGGIAGCGDEPEAAPPDTDPAPTEVEDPMAGLQLTIGLEKLEYGAGETVPVSLQLSNRSDELRTLSFRTTQRFDLVLTTEDGRELSRWSEGQAFGQALGEETLDPGRDGPIWEAEWTAPDSPGSYRLEAVVLPAEGELRMAVPIEVR